MLPNAEVNVELIEERNEVLSEAVESIVDLLSGALDEGVDETNAPGLLHLLSPSFAHSGPMDHVEAGHGPKGPRRGLHGGASKLAGDVGEGPMGGKGPHRPELPEEVAEELIAISELLQQVHELERELAEHPGWGGGDKTVLLNASYH